jgi:hypothetical protein
LLTAEKISQLKNNKQYKKTMGRKYNWKYSKAIVSLPDFSMELEFIKRGVSLKQLNFMYKGIIWVFKRAIISKEIGLFRNAFLERLLNSTLEYDFDICNLMTPDMMWISCEIKKLEIIRKILIQFITDSDIQKILFKIAKIDSDEERKHFIHSINEKMESIFDNKFDELEHDSSVSNELEYIKYLHRRERKLIKKYEKNALTGNFFTVNRNKEEETSNG